MARGTRGRKRQPRDRYYSNEDAFGPSMTGSASRPAGTMARATPSTIRTPWPHERLAHRNVMTGGTRGARDRGVNLTPGQQLTLRGPDTPGQQDASDRPHATPGTTLGNTPADATYGGVRGASLSLKAREGETPSGEGVFAAERMEGRKVALLGCVPSSHKARQRHD